MAGHGGARPGSGPKPGNHRIQPSALKAAIEAKIGMPYEQMLAESQAILFNEFKLGNNRKEYINFTENMSKRILENQVQEVSVTNPIEDLSNEEIQNRINNLLTRQALSQSDAETDAQDGNQENQTI